MADRDAARIVPDHAPDEDSLSGPPSPISSMLRRDTASTNNSGSYYFPIHGKCPRCQHHHTAATIRILKDLTRVSHVPCERCGEKWLAFGGGSSTRLSLLSTQTTEPDPVEKSVRTELVEMVRSLGPPEALTPVPESPASRAPSREPAFRPTNERIDQEGNRPSTANAKPGSSDQADIPQTAADSKDATPPSAAPDPSTQGAVPKTHVKQFRALIAYLKRNLGKRFPGMKRIHFARPIRSRRKQKGSSKSQEKRPVTQPPDSNENLNAERHTHPLSPRDAPSLTQTGPSEENNEATRQTGQTDTPIPNNVSSDEKEMLRNMSHEQRAAWLRGRFSDLKCRCRQDCYCRLSQRPTSSMAPANASSTRHNPSPDSLQPTFQDIARRRHSDELVGLGSHFEGITIHPQRPLSISNSTWSQASTAVGQDSISVTSAPRLSWIGVAQTGTRSRSPGPRSPPPGATLAFRVREQPRQDEVEGRPSMDTNAAGREVRSMSERPGVNRRRTPLPGSIVDGNGSSSHQQASPSTHAPAPPSAGHLNSTPVSTPDLNGYRTDDERNRDLPPPRGNDWPDS
ncbi:hypothetical protein K469DRAFT_686635 [Zopfia rhizophila CBS 207.26]|uniref:Uncharacterized protein n=1 Tax=Zopfia rhizophila CBS 207.26 TaxID=1314779 RepID=A0A6A6EUF7_9PEZI|nr:hypothetical protein K469DRAFT_686635 [Zopfia rhizophila CBS 207.26]